VGAAVYDGGRVGGNGGMVSKAILNDGFCILDWKNLILRDSSCIQHIENSAGNTQLNGIDITNTIGLLCQI